VEKQVSEDATARVKVIQEQTRRALRLAVAFALSAAAAIVIPHSTGAWLPMHLFLVGTLGLAISGATRLFTVTWSAAEPVTGWPVTAQRWLVAAGAAGLAAGRELDWPTPLVACAGLAVTAGLALLAGLLMVEVRTAKVRRFRPAVAFYLTAIGAGLAGTGLGAAMVTGRAGLRDAHVILNVLGLVGLVIAGTLPFFTATQARMKMSRRASPARLHGVLVWLAVATAVAAAAALTESPRLEGIGLGAYAAGVAYLGTTLPMPRRKQLAWGGPRLVLLAAGVLWWVGAVAVAAVRAAGSDPALTEHQLVALVVGGYVQILIGSLAYLGPVLRGGGHRRLSNGFTLTRSWFAVAAANGAAVAWTVGSEQWTRAAVVALAIDIAWRSVRLAVRRLPAEERAPEKQEVTRV
jgi:nitrite reductase (NO-forming)